MLSVVPFWKNERPGAHSIFLFLYASIVCGGNFSRVGFLVRYLGKRADRKSFGGFSCTQGGPLGSSSRECQLTDVSSYGCSLLLSFSKHARALRFPKVGQAKA